MEHFLLQAIYLLDVLFNKLNRTRKVKLIRLLVELNITDKNFKFFMLLYYVIIFHYNKKKLTKVRIILIRIIFKVEPLEKVVGYFMHH